MFVGFIIPVKYFFLKNKEIIAAGIKRPQILFLLNRLLLRRFKITKGKKLPLYLADVFKNHCNRLAASLL